MGLTKKRGGISVWVPIAMDVLDTFPKMQMLCLCLTLCVPVFFFVKVFEEDHLISSFCLRKVYLPSGGRGTR